MPHDESALVPLDAPIPFGLAVLDGKEITNDAHAGEIVALSATGAQIRVGTPLDTRADVRVTVDLDDGPASIYAKVHHVTPSDDGAEARLRFSSVPPAAAAAFARLL